MSSATHANHDPSWSPLYSERPEGSRRELPMLQLLAAIVVVAILAAIAVPALYHHRDRERDAAAQASVRDAHTAAIEIGRRNDGAFSGPRGVSVQNLVAAEPALEGVQLAVPLVMADVFTVRVRSETGNTFEITRNDDGTTDLTCASADDGGCPSDGTWD